jgi:hypothetical protein
MSSEQFDSAVDPTKASVSKKSMLASDDIVVCARTGSSGSNVEFNWVAEQNW